MPRVKRTVASFAHEVGEDEYGGAQHGDVGGYGGAFYAEAEGEDEYWRYGYVEEGADDHGEHGADGVAGGAHYVVE